MIAGYDSGPSANSKEPKPNVLEWKESKNYSSRTCYDRGLCSVKVCEIQSVKNSVISLRRKLMKINW